MRDYGSGSINEIRPGRWRLKVSAGVDVVTGRRIVVQETFTGGAKAARARLAEIVAEHSRRGSTAGTVTLGRIIDVWLAGAGHAKNTRVNYDRARSRIPERVLATQAAKISPHDVDQLYTALQRDYGVHATHYVHALISGAYTNARRLRWLVDHPARDARLPKLTKRASTTPTANEARQIIAAARDEQQRLWLRLALVLGRRRSEVLALRWSDVDLDAGVAHIERTLEDDLRGVKATKTGDDVDLAIDIATVKAIRSWQKGQRERAIGAGMPLTSDPWLLSDELDSSLPWRPTLATRRWAATRVRAKVRSTIRLQDFRKANTTNLIAGGIDVRTVAGRSGHDPKMALGIYANVVDAANRAAADVIAQVIDG